VEPPGHALEGNVTMNEQVKFVAAMLQAQESFSELCGRFGISRKQGYKWKKVQPDRADAL
jgi:transposase-like protein